MIQAFTHTYKSKSGKVVRCYIVHSDPDKYDYPFYKFWRRLINRSVVVKNENGFYVYLPKKELNKITKFTT